MKTGGSETAPLRKSRTGTGDSEGEEEEKAGFPIRQAQGRIFDRLGAGSLTDCGPAHQERLGGLGVGCPEEAGLKPARTQEGPGTGGWWKGWRTPHRIPAGTPESFG